MREYFAGEAIRVPDRGSLTDDVLTNAAAHPDQVLFSAGDRDVTSQGFLDEVQQGGKGLLAAGVEPGDRVGILSRTRYEWTLLDYAVWSIGGVTVPLYPTASDDQVAWILRDADVRVLVVETAAQLERVESLRADLPDLREVWCLGQGGVETLTRAGRRVTGSSWDAARDAVTPSSTATIIYTSGTTGRPKGCVLTHANFMAEIDTTVTALHELFEAEDAATVLFLPLAHVFPRVVQVGAVRSRVRLAYASDLGQLPAVLAASRPTFLLGVPRVFERLLNRMSQQAAVEGHSRRFHRAVDTAIAYSRSLEGRTGPLLRARHAALDRLVYRRLREELGGRCRYAVSGGAPLGDQLAHFFRGIGLTVLEGYGLTETTAAVAVTRPDEYRVGTVGRPTRGVGLRLSDDGELLVRGPQVFVGYWGDEPGTHAVLDADGWLHTGDLAEIDAEGVVRIVGRQREVLVTTGGKRIIPEGLESRLTSHPLVAQALVVGDGKPYAAALLTLDRDATVRWAAERQLPVRDVDDLLADGTLRGGLQSAVDQANRSVSQAEAVRRFTVLPREWSEDSGHVTPSLKLRRSVIMQDFQGDIERLYER